MGIGSTVKNILSTDGPTANTTVNGTADRSVPNGAPNSYEKRDSKFVSDRSSRQLPPGTGPGTSGKPAVAPEKSSLERSRTDQDTSGYGTDAAAAMGGTLAGTHQGRLGNNRAVAHSTSGPSTATYAAAGSGNRDNSMSREGGGRAASVPKASALDSNIEGAVREPTGQGLVTGSGFLEGEHDFGHTEYTEYKPTEGSQDNTSQLHPVIHEKVRHLEFEEIAHVKNRERHVLHVQHHTQPVIVSEELQERLRDNLRPVTRIHEVHANKQRDSTLLKDQIYQHRDSVSHAEKERQVIEKGTTVNETIHHHIHHIIQPVIEKETIEKERIRTTVPFHEVTHEAPIVHESTIHKPVPLEEFLRQGGTLKRGVHQDEIVGKILHVEKCTREIDGGAHSAGMNKNV